MMRAVTDFVSAERHQLTLGGRPFRFLGTNAYYLLEQAAWGREGSREARDVVADFFDLAVAAGLGVVRLWGFNERTTDPPALRTLLAPGRLGPGVDALGEIITLAHDRGLRLIITLADYWNYYGGLTQYARWTGYENQSPDGHPDHYVEELFYAGSYSDDRIPDDRSPRAIFLDFAIKLIGRFRDEPAILAWELINEPRVRAIGLSDPLQRRTRQEYLRLALRDWISETAAEIRRRAAPRQLLSIGGLEIGDLSYFFSDPRVSAEIDLIDTHLYPHGVNEFDPATREGRGEYQLLSPARTLKVLRQAVEYARVRVGKPFYLGEFGLGHYSNLRPRDRRREFARWSSLLLEAGAAGIILWQIMPPSRALYDPYEVQLKPESAGALKGCAPADAEEVAAFLRAARADWQEEEPS